MKKDVSNDNCVRCHNCGYIYDKHQAACPQCNEENQDSVFEEIISESSEPVFNINDQ